MSHPILSIITVCKNSGFSLLRTFASVSPLLSENVEWIIADGLSNDCSVDCLRVISFFNSPFIHIFNQRDVSIYDAMNKASAYTVGVLLYLLIQVIA